LQQTVYINTLIKNSLVCSYIPGIFDSRGSAWTCGKMVKMERMINNEKIDIFLMRGGLFLVWIYLDIQSYGFIKPSLCILHLRTSYRHKEYSKLLKAQEYSSHLQIYHYQFDMIETGR